MIQLEKFDLGNNDFIFIEVATKDSGITNSGVADKLHASFQEALEKAKLFAAKALTTFRDLDVTPDEVAVEFGIKVSQEYGAIISTSGVEANLKVKLKWKKQDPLTTSEGKEE